MIDLDELTGDAKDEARRIIDAWPDRPKVKSPEGTVFSEHQQKRHWGSRTLTARLPNGHWYELMAGRPEREDPREVPPVLFAYVVSQMGEIFAYSRIASMSCGMGIEEFRTSPRPSDPEMALQVGLGLGLEVRYRVGMMSRGLRQRTRTVSDGWEF